MNPPVPGLRRLWLNSKSPTKVSLVVAPETVIETSEELAAQLVLADSHFRDVPATPEVPAEPPKAKGKKGA